MSIKSESFLKLLRDIAEDGNVNIQVSKFYHLPDDQACISLSLFYAKPWTLALAIADWNDGWMDLFGLSAPVEQVINPDTTFMYWPDLAWPDNYDSFGTGD